MTPLVVVEIPKAKQLILQIASSPKGHDVEVLSPDCPDESFNERKRNRHVRHGFDFGNLKYSKICLPSVKSEQWVIIAADVFRQVGSTGRTIEHPTERESIDGTGVYAKANDSTCVLIHDNEYPMALKSERLTAEQINTPQGTDKLTAAGR